MSTREPVENQRDGEIGTVLVAGAGPATTAPNKIELHFTI